VRVDPADIAPADRGKALAAADALTVREIRDPDDPAFDAAYDLLDAFFGPIGELEDRAVLARFTRERTLHYGPGLWGTYHLVGAWHGAELVGVRDCYVDIDESLGVCLVALSHSFVVPAWRRSGLGALFRALPVALAREAGPRPTILAAEMELVEPSRPETVVRLVAYGRSGFGVFDPGRFQYSQPDFRAPPGASHTAIPMLGVVRLLGLGPSEVTPDVAAAFPRLFHVCHRMYLPPSRVDPSEHHALDTLASSTAPVRVLALPTGMTDEAALAPLLRSAVLGRYPVGLRGPADR
jgi:hypothetical protein